MRWGYQEILKLVFLVKYFNQWLLNPSQLLPQPTSDIHGITPLPPTPAPTPQKESASPAQANPPQAQQAETAVLKTPSKATPAPSTSPTASPIVDLPPTAEKPIGVKSAMMAHVNTVDSFFIHLKDDEADLLALVDQLYEFYNDGEGQKLAVNEQDTERVNGFFFQSSACDYSSFCQSVNNFLFQAGALTLLRADQDCGIRF